MSCLFGLRHQLKNETLTYTKQLQDSCERDLREITEYKHFLLLQPIILKGMQASNSKNNYIIEISV